MVSHIDLVVYTYNQLESITGGFDRENLIGHTRFGSVFRGKIQRGLEAQEVTVKTWEYPPKYEFYQDYQLSRLQEEVTLLTDSNLNSHPNLVKLIGYCCEDKRLAVVYDLKSVDTLRNLILSDKFRWVARMKVAYGFACVLEYLHDKQLLLRNIDPAHIMLDQAFNPILFDFGMLVTGVPGGSSYPHKGVWGSHGYVDPHICHTGIWSDKTDVFLYGVILLGLIANRMYDREADRAGRPRSSYNFVFYWAEDAYKRSKSKSLLHKSLEMDPFFNACDGPEITKLAMRCVREYPWERPTMKKVVYCLQDLSVFQCYEHVLSIPDTLLGAVAANLLEESND